MKKVVLAPQRNGTKYSSNTLIFERHPVLLSDWDKKVTRHNRDCHFCRFLFWAPSDLALRLFRKNCVLEMALPLRRSSDKALISAPKIVSKILPIQLNSNSTRNFKSSIHKKNRIFTEEEKFKSFVNSSLFPASIESFRFRAWIDCF